MFKFSSVRSVAQDMWILKEMFVKKICSSNLTDTQIVTFVLSKLFSLIFKISSSENTELMHTFFYAKIF